MNSATSITLAGAISWSDNAEVKWQGRADIGAYPYTATLLASATYTTNGVVTPIGDTRFVIQYRAGLPIATDSSAPFTFSYTAGDVFMVYAKNAQTGPVVTAQLGGAAFNTGSLTVNGTLRFTQ